jgi:REP element-mobilizing transposase RayT
MEVMPAHVHLLAPVDPQFGVHRLVVKRLKGRSSLIFLKIISTASVSGGEVSLEASVPNLRPSSRLSASPAMDRSRLATNSKALNIIDGLAPNWQVEVLSP